MIARRFFKAGLCLATLVGAAAHAADWPAVGGDLANSHYSPARQITPANVKQLGGAWMHKFDGENSRATPVVVGGVMYVTAGAHVYALNAKTGEVVWSVKPDAPPQGLFKGVAIGQGLVFVGLSNSNMIALDAKTGDPVWSMPVGAEATPPAPAGFQWIAGAPSYANGVVVAGVSGARAASDRNDGRIVGLDAASGKVLWTFHVIPGPGEPGHETWQQDNDVWKKAGGAVWMTPAIDPDLGLVYLGTGNPIPELGGEVRGGDNLFTASAVALDLKTGKLRWYYQTTHHDIWEHDLGTPLVLYDAVVNGKPVRAVAVMRTDGYLFLLDRATGQPLQKVAERAVPQNKHLKTAPTQPFPVGADRVGPGCAQKDMVPPGFILGCYFDPIDVNPPNLITPLVTMRSSPMAYDPHAGVFFAAGTVAPQWMPRWPDPFVFSSLGNAPGLKSYGVLAAVDARTDKILWQKRVPRPIENGSGATVTAGGVLFHGEPDGNMQALDPRSGDLLWQFQTGTNESGPAAVYELDGDEYVAVLATNTLWAFKLGGTLAQQPAPALGPTETAFRGRIEETDAVVMSATSTDNRTPNLPRSYTDEYAFQPLRVKVKAGGKVTWTNKGQMPHDATALDGSWTTGEIAPGKSATVTFDKPGTYTYVCKEHPWSYAQLVVE